MTGFRGWLVETEKRAGFPPMPKGLSPRSEKVDLGQGHEENEKSHALGKMGVKGQGNESQWIEKMGLTSERPSSVKAVK